MPGDGGTTELVVGFLGGTGLATIVSSVLVGLFNRRKLGADATKAITEAAAGVVQDLRQQVKDERAEHVQEVQDLREEVARLREGWRQEREATRRVLQLHVAFDQLAIAKLAEAGIDLGMRPPPLLPPLREDLA